jgi:hypothetical protein
MLFDPNGPYTSDPVTKDEVTANDAVPCNDPVNIPTNDPVNEPVFYEELNARNELESNPMLELLFNMRVSNEAEAIKYDAVKLLYDDVNKKAAESYPSKKSAFTAYEALVELLAYEALNTDIEDVWLVKITLLPFTLNEPVI